MAKKKSGRKKRTQKSKDDSVKEANKTAKEAEVDFDTEGLDIPGIDLKALSAHEALHSLSGLGKTSKPLFNAPEDKELASKLHKALSDMFSHVRPNWVATRCPKCNIKLNIPKAEATRCILCGNKELEVSERSILS